MKTNAQEFANSIDFPCVFWAGNGCPGGQTVALLESTEFGFDLSEIEGEVTDGIFNATNLASGPKTYNCGWRFTDLRQNIVYMVQVFNNKGTWESQKAEYDATY